jgi:hypothetical protein
MADPLFYKRMRIGMRGDDPMHKIAAPLSQREFAQGFVEENPVVGPLAMAAMVPGYQAYKAIFRPKNRSPASLDQFFAGLQGLGRGVAANFGVGESLLDDEELPQ